MTKRVLVAMDSYRLAECAVPLACYICGTDNNYNTELCRHCAAPLALSHQARTQGVRPQMVAVLGTAAAGKTVYLGMLLDMLTRQNGRVQVLARGAFSITLQQRTMMALSNCRFPEKTPNEPDRWNWVHCQAKVNSKKNPMELIMPDMAGEAILEEIDHPNAYPAIHSFLEKCSAVILLADTDRIERGGAEQNYFLMKLITYLSEQDNRKARGKSTRPVAIVFSKADRCEPCFDNPELYAKEKTPNLWQQVQQRFTNYGFFASGVAGSVGFREEPGEGTSAVPLRIEPRGIVEPFEWLVRKIQLVTTMAPLSPKDLQVASPPQSHSSGTVAVEQAIFTSARTSSKDGYQLVAWSPGISSDDARQLAVWGPAHDSMIADDPMDVSLNFHPLGDHKFCVSRTVLGAAEYSGRGGRQVYTHCFVLDADAFLKFHNDPFRVLSAALAIHDLRPGAKLPTDLPSLRMLPSGGPVDAGLIRFFDSPVQQQFLVAWTHHAMTAKKLMFTGGYNDRFLTVFFNLLPVSIRPYFSFSTRLRYSPRRNFKLIGLANDIEEQKKAARQEGCSVFQFDSPARTPEASRHPWATWVQVALCHREPDEAARMIGQVPLSTRLEDLGAVGNRLRVEMSSKKRMRETDPSPAPAAPLVVPEDNTDRDELFVLVERALEGDVTALERLNATWCAQPDRQLEALRQDCARHFVSLSKEKNFEPGSKGAIAVEILSLILRVSL